MRPPRTDRSPVTSADSSLAERFFRSPFRQELRKEIVPLGIETNSKVNGAAGLRLGHGLIPKFDAVCHHFLSTSSNIPSCIGSSLRALLAKPVEVVAPQDISLSRYESLRLRTTAPGKPLDECLAEVEERVGRARMLLYVADLRLQDGGLTKKHKQVSRRNPFYLLWRSFFIFSWQNHLRTFQTVTFGKIVGVKMGAFRSNSAFAENYVVGQSMKVMMLGTFRQAGGWGSN